MDTDTQPRVSVIMPTYNAAAYLLTSINSIITQSMSDFEFLIYDDGSTDGSIEILQDIAIKDKRVKLFKRSHCGYLTHLNDGIHRARAQYIARMDADDISLKERFRKQVEYLDQHPKCLAVGTAHNVIGPQGDRIGNMQVSLNHKDIDRNILEGINCGIAHPSAMYRRNAVLALGGYRAQYEWAEDTDLWLRLGEQGELANLPEILFSYRLHLKSVCHTRSSDQFEKGRLMIIEACKRRGIAAPEWIQSQKRTLPQTSHVNIYTRWVNIALRSQNYLAAFKYTILSLKENPTNRLLWKRFYRISREFATTKLKSYSGLYK